MRSSPAAAALVWHPLSCPAIRTVDNKLRSANLFRFHTGNISAVSGTIELRNGREIVDQAIAKSPLPTDSPQGDTRPNSTPNADQSPQVNLVSSEDISQATTATRVSVPIVSSTQKPQSGFRNGLRLFQQLLFAAFSLLILCSMLALYAGFHAESVGELNPDVHLLPSGNPTAPSEELAANLSGQELSLPPAAAPPTPAAAAQPVPPPAAPPPLAPLGPAETVANSTPPSPTGTPENSPTAAPENGPSSPASPGPGPIAVPSPQQIANSAPSLTVPTTNPPITLPLNSASEPATAGAGSSSPPQPLPGNDSSSTVSSPENVADGRFAVSTARFIPDEGQFRVIPGLQTGSWVPVQEQARQPGTNGSQTASVPARPRNPVRPFQPQPTIRARTSRPLPPPVIPGEYLSGKLAEDDFDSETVEIRPASTHGRAPNSNFVPNSDSPSRANSASRRSAPGARLTGQVDEPRRELQPQIQIRPGARGQHE